MKVLPDAAGGVMKTNRTVKELLRGIEGSLQVVILSLAYYFSFRFFYDSKLFPGYLGRGKYLLIAIYALLVIALFSLNRSFVYGRLKLSHIFISQAIDIAIVDFVTYLQLSLIADKMITFVPIIYLYIIDLILCLVLCYVYTSIYHKINMPRKTLLVYGTEEAHNLEEDINTQSKRLNVAQSVSSDLGLEKIIEMIPEYDALIINDVEAELRNDLLKYCYGNGIRTYMVPKISDILIRGSSDVTMHDTPFLLSKGQGLSIYSRMLKRLMDIVLCLIALIVSSPILLIIAIAIKLEDHGPVFYKQERITQDEEPFEIIKFRSMVVDAEKDGISIPAIDNDPRITKVGKIIRRFRVDELPQIFNILKGEMSIVGPRPERTEHVEKYKTEIPEFVFRYKVKGGLTGYAQVYGKYNTTAYDKLRLDLLYIENYTVLLDIKLIIETVRILFSKESTEGFANDR